MPNNVNLHRVLNAPPERVYRAFIDAQAVVKWLPPDGYTATIEEFSPTVGGSYKMSFTNFTTGESHSFSGKYLELVPGEFLKYTDEFDDPELPGEIHVTVTLQEVICGTDLKIVQEGIPDSIPVEMCYLGWQQSLNALAHLVEPEINDEIGEGE